jgi:hypothetical protein
MKDKSVVSLAKSLFDAKFYARTYPDVCQGTTDLATEYFSTGWRQGRNPNAFFDTRFYLDTNPDARKSGECPLIHYVRKGAVNGRLPSPRPGTTDKDSAKRSELVQDKVIDHARAAINRAVSPRQRARDWGSKPFEELADGSKVRRALNSIGTETSKGLILAVSHDDYTKVDGGIQNCIGDEEAEFRRGDYVYVHICPARPLPMLSDETSTSSFFVSVRIQRETIGIMSLENLLCELVSFRTQLQSLTFIVHHLLGFSPELVVDAVRRLMPDDVIFWVHDFFTLCSNYALLRNDVAFCHAPKVNSQVCSVCCYGVERRQHVDRITAAFEALRPTVLAPSETALAFWKEHQNMPFGAAAVVPHGKLVFKEKPTIRDCWPLKIGFLGVPFYNKGWHTFEALAARHSGDSRYEFFHLGVAEVGSARNIKFVEVSVKSQGREAMAEAVASVGIDAVVNWSLCYETFSFTTHEALAGGAFVIARKGAGNIWPAVQQYAAERGCAVETEDELFELFASGSLDRLTKQRQFGEFAINAATATYFLGGKVHG